MCVSRTSLYYFYHHNACAKCGWLNVADRSAGAGSLATPAHTWALLSCNTAPKQHCSHATSQPCLPFTLCHHSQATSSWRCASRSATVHWQALWKASTYGSCCIWSVCYPCSTCVAFTCPAGNKRLSVRIKGRHGPAGRSGGLVAAPSGAMPAGPSLPPGPHGPFPPPPPGDGPGDAAPGAAG